MVISPFLPIFFPVTWMKITVHASMMSCLDFKKIQYANTTCKPIFINYLTSISDRLKYHFSSCPEQRDVFEPPLCLSLYLKCCSETIYTNFKPRMILPPSQL